MRVEASQQIFLKKEVTDRSPVDNQMLPNTSHELFSIPFSSNGETAKKEIGGDLADMDFQTRVAVLDHTVELYYDSILDYQKSHGELPLAVRERIGILYDSIDKLRFHVDNPNNYPNHAAQHIKERNIRGDIESIGRSNIERIAARIAAADKVRFLIDVDGTLTNNPDYYLSETIPGGAIAEPRIQKAGRGEMVDMYVQTKHVLLRDASSIFEEAGQRAEDVQARNGVNEFFAGAHGLTAEYEVMSANFLPFVTGILKQFPAAVSSGIKIWAVTEDNAVSVEKESAIRHVAQSNPDQAIIYIGDGASDLPALEPKAAELIAGYFALKNSAFERELKEKNLPYLSYGDFDEVNMLLQQIAINKPSHKSA